MARQRSQRTLLLLLAVASGVACSELDRTRWAARFGSAPSQYALGQRLAAGEGVARDRVAGIEWLEKAAAQGSLPAQTLLVQLYDERGEGGDAERGEHWLRTAAAAGDAPSQLLLGERLLRAPGGDSEASEWIARAAGAGYPRAQLVQARLLAARGAPDAEVIALVTRAAEQGEPEAAAELASLAERGAVDVAPEQVRAWLVAAAEGGGAPAQYALAERLTRGGEGEEPDLAGARAWYARAAEQGYAPAQEALGFIHQTGLGVAKGPGEAAKWFRLAAEQGRASAQNQLGVLYAQGLLPDEETAEQITFYSSLADRQREDVARQLEKLAATAKANNDRHAAEWYRQAIERDYAPAMTNLAKLIDEGRVEGVGPEEALRLYERAAELGNPVAQSVLAVRYSRGDDADAAASLRMLEAAAKGGHGPAQLALAQLYASGRGVELDAAQAAHWYGKAVESGQQEAESPYAVLLAIGTGVEKDEEAALALFERAADRGDPTAQWSLGVFHEEGRGGLRADERQAQAWWRRAAEQGHSLAQAKLGLSLVRGKGPRRQLEEGYAWLVASGVPEAKQWIDALEAELTAPMLARAKKLAEEKSAIRGAAEPSDTRE